MAEVTPTDHAPRPAAPARREAPSRRRLPSVLAAVAAERRRQGLLGGQQDHPDGTGPTWAYQADIHGTSGRMAESHDRANWALLAQQRLYAALVCDDPARLRAGLVQLAVVAVAWADAIDRREDDHG